MCRDNGRHGTDRWQQGLLPRASPEEASTKGREIVVGSSTPVVEVVVPITVVSALKIVLPSIQRKERKETMGIIVVILLFEQVSKKGSCDWGFEFNWP